MMLREGASMEENVPCSTTHAHLDVGNRPKVPFKTKVVEI
jgi:hypothetical protein